MDLVGTLIDALDDLTGKPKPSRSTSSLNQPQDGLRVKAICEDRLLLEVTNLGLPGSFAARLELIDGLDKVHEIGSPAHFGSYGGVWERGQTSISELAHGEKDRLIIGRIVRPSDLPNARAFRMAFFDEVDGHFAEYASTGWIEGVTSIYPPRLELRVSISSGTPKSGRHYVNTFVVNADDPQILRDERAFTSEFTGIRVWHY